MTEQNQRGRIEFGPFVFDTLLGKLSKHGTPIRLSGMPLKVFQHLLDRPGEIVSRGELQSLLWSGTAFGDFEQGLNTAVNTVRKTLGDSADGARYVETIPGLGYRFIAPLRAGAPQETGIAPATSAAAESRPETGKPTTAKLRWGMALAFAFAMLAGGAWWMIRPVPRVLSDGATPSASREANDQYELAKSFLTYQNDLPMSRNTFERALELDPHFGSARAQCVLTSVIEIFNGYANDGIVLSKAEEQLHQVEAELPSSDGLLLAAQAAVYLAQGRLDRIPVAKLEEEWRQATDGGTWLAIIRMLEDQNREALAILRMRIDRKPLDAPPRMFLGEVLRTQGDTNLAIQALQRVLQQAPMNVTAAWFLTMAYLDQGRADQARALLEGMRSGFEKNYMWRHAWAILCAAEGNHKEASKTMDEDTLKFAHLTWAVTSATADFYALQGDPSKAIEWLQLSVGRGDERISYFQRNPRLATLRDDARFQSLLKSVRGRRR